MKKPLNYQTSKGMVMVIFAMVIAVILPLMLAFVINTASAMQAKAEAKGAADAAAKAGMQEYLRSQDMTAATTKADEVAQNNVSLKGLTITATVEGGTWDKSTQTFISDPTTTQAVEVKVQYSGDYILPAVMGGSTGFSGEVSSVATTLTEPVNVTFVVPLRHFIRDDSLVSTHGTYSEAKLLEMYEDLGSIKYADKLDTDYSKQMTCFDEGAGNPCESDPPNWTEMVLQMGLDKHPYPYSGHNEGWVGWLKYMFNNPVMRTLYNTEQGYGYTYQNLIHYWMEEQFTFDLTPDLWKTKQQPLFIIKEMVDYIGQKLSERNDGSKGALVLTEAIAGSSSCFQQVDMELTTDFNSITQRVRGLQAGHFCTKDLKGNVYSFPLFALHAMPQQVKGSKHAIFFNRATFEEQLVIPSETDRMIKDYITNNTNPQKIKIHTISVGKNAHRNRMGTYAKLGNGLHFNVRTKTESISPIQGNLDNLINNYLVSSGGGKVVIVK